MAISTIEMDVPNAVSVEVSDYSLSVELSDARRILVPTAWYPRLMHAKPEERLNWRLVGDGDGIHWPDLDEDISVANLLAGKPSGESQASFQRWLKSRSG